MGDDVTNVMFPFNAITTTSSALSTQLLGLVDNKCKELAYFVLTSILSCGVAVFGLIANMINIAVFVKQGFKENITLSFAVLAIFDLASLLSLLWVAIASNPLVRDHPELPFHAMEVIYLTGSLPRSFMSRLSSLVTVYISVERCLCVIKPLAVKNWFNRRRFFVYTSSITLLYILIWIPLYLGYKVILKTNPMTNKTVYRVLLLPDRHLLSVTPGSIDSIVSTASFVVIAICAAILINALRQRKKWLENEAGTKVLSQRDRRAAVTVMFVAVMFIVCSLPTTVCRVAITAFQEFNRGGRYVNIYFVTWSLAFLVEAISASSNIFVYLFTSIRYRKALHSLLESCVRRKKAG